MRAIREACGIVLQREGPEALTTQRIAEVAGVNIASLYQYFPNKDAVLADFLEQEAGRIAQRTAETFALIDRLSRQSLELTLAAVIELELEQRRALTRLNPGFFARYPQGVDVHAKVEALTRSRENPGWTTWLPEFLAQHRARLRSGDTGLLAALCQGALQGVVAQTPALPQDAAGFAHAKVELLLLLLNYLLAQPPSMEDCARLFSELSVMRDQVNAGSTGRDSPAVPDA